STPAVTTHLGSNVSEASMTTQDSLLAVAFDSDATSTLIRPDDAGPVSSVIAPRGSPPPVNVSICGNPLERKSVAGFSPILNTGPNRVVRFASICDFATD